MRAGKKLREARVNRGITVKWMAQQVGVNRCTYWKWETDRTHIDLEHAVTVCRLLGISISEIVA